MEKEQAREWSEAQSIRFSVDLVEAAKKHLKFLAAVDRNRHLYEEHVLERAIFRYNAFWLPLLAKHLENPVVADDEPLVVPLDCEWIWHCHRLNPLRYKFDCEKLYGRILGYRNVISSVEATSKSKTEEIWNKMYPEEPYQLDLNKPFSEDALPKVPENAKFTSYDLIAAVKRQISFTYQISRQYAADDKYLNEAVRRYKGFLHMIRTNDKKDRKCFYVPTYDIDLIWHTHQLHPESYCKDLSESVGRVCHHNDTISDRSPGNILQTGFSDITRLWEEDYGRSYWTAGTLHRGDAPTPVTLHPVDFSDNNISMADQKLNNCGNPIQFPSMKSVEVHLEFVEIKNVAEGQKENLVVYFSKKQHDKVFNAKRCLRTSSESGEKQVASFKCEPTGDFLFELMMSRSSDSNELELLGSYTLSLQELMASGSQLSANMWLPMEPVSGNTENSDPILVHTSISFTPPVPAPQVFRFVTSEDNNILTQVLDQDGKQVFSLDMRSIKGSTGSLGEVYGITDSGEECKLAEVMENKWTIKGSNGSLKLQNNSGKDDSLCELVGNKMVKLFPGRRLEFETVPLEKQNLKQGFLTAVEFSIENPYGKAVALIDFQSKTFKAIEEWIIVPGITLVFLLSEIVKEEMNAKIGHITQVSSKTGETEHMVKKEGFADCAKCFSCGVHAGGENLGMVKKEGFADCAKCFSCGVHAGGENLGMVKKEGFADCAKCFSCGVHAGGENLGMVKNGFVVGAECSECGAGCAHLGTKVQKNGFIVGEIGNMVKNGTRGAECSGSECGAGCAHLADKVKKIGFADCAKCYGCEVLSGEKLAKCTRCTFCTVLSGDGDGGGKRAGDYGGMVDDGVGAS